MPDLAARIKNFASINRAPGTTWIDATKCKTPHKSLLLLAVLDLGASACVGNTPIKISCGKDGHSERIRKEGQRFFRECAECGTSKVYFVNSQFLGTVYLTGNESCPVRCIW